MQNLLNELTKTPEENGRLVVDGKFIKEQDCRTCSRVRRISDEVFLKTMLLRSVSATC